MLRAALYLRSSKDRSDVSIDAQRRQLQQLASDRSFVITAEFSDVVESGKDDQRSGFQQLLAAVRNKRRGWDTLLILDTSRLARRRHIALIFEEVECRKHGVKVVYKSLPESDPITEMLLKSILQAMDEWHSLTSRQKGLAGMAENVRQGWRAGGRAPLGYRLEQVETSTMREGAPVVKTRLQPSADAPRVSAYLKAKARGLSRKEALRTASLTVSDTTAIGIEWNALTYAGHTVWNVRYETGPGGYAGGVKRRPRAEWVVQKGTHPALITDEEAEALIGALEATSKANSRRTRASYLLTGVLRAPDGTPWRGEGEGFYRLGKGKRVKATLIEQAVLADLARNLNGPEFVSAFTTAVKAQAVSRDAELPKLKRELADIERQIDRITGLLGATTTPEPLLRQIETLDGKRTGLAREIATRDQLDNEAAKVRALTEVQVSKLLRALAEDMDALDREHLKDFVRGMLDKVELDPAAETFQLVFRLDAGNRVASPRVGHSIPPTLAWERRALRAA